MDGEMDGRLRAVGEVEEFDLGEISKVDVLKGTMIGLVHKGSTEVDIWTRRTQAVQLKEAREIARIMKEEDPDVLEIMYGPRRNELEALRLEIVEAHEREGEPIPTHMDSPITIRQAIRAPDEDYRQLQREAIASNLSYARGPSFFGADIEAYVAEIERLGCLQAVYRKAMEVQRLSAESFPSASGAGGDGPGVDPEPEPRTGDDSSS